MIMVKDVGCMEDVRDRDEVGGCRCGVGAIRPEGRRGVTGWCNCERKGRGP